jgi:hypothetical protein
MKSKYEKNFTDRGYTMNYDKLKIPPFLKNQVLQFKIELQEITPLIWRRLLVPMDYNFWDLHVAIQDSMGWQDSHLHHFKIHGKGKKKAIQIGIPDFDRMSDLEEVYPGWEIMVLDYFDDLGVEAEYLYDYGESWMHMVKLEGYLIKDNEIEYPICIGGERTCPPEDCGGVPGYYNVIKTLSDTTNDDYEEMKEWVGNDWNPDLFYKDLVKFDDPYKRWKVAFLER